MINIAICDDVIQVCSYIENIISAYCKKIIRDINIKPYYSGETLIDDIIRNNRYYDIIFLDIHLDKLSGVEVGEKIRMQFKNLSSQLVYISADISCAMNLFTSIPFGFLIKPFSESQVEEIIDRWIKVFENNTNSFLYKKGTEIFKVEFNKVLYFESIGRQLQIVTNDIKDVFYGNLKDVYNEAMKFNFINIHRSYIVNFNHIIKIGFNELKMSNSENLPISPPKRKDLKKFFIENNICIKKFD